MTTILDSTHINEPTTHIYRKKKSKQNESIINYFINH
jgi:hypothetical protein